MECEGDEVSIDNNELTPYTKVVAASTSDRVPYPVPLHNGNLYEDPNDEQENLIDGIDKKLKMLGSVSVKDSKLIHFGPAYHFHQQEDLKETITLLSSQPADPSVALMDHRPPIAAIEEPPEQYPDSEYEWVPHYPPSASDYQTDDENRAETPLPVAEELQCAKEERYIVSACSNSYNNSENNIHKVENVAHSASEHSQNIFPSTNPFLMAQYPKIDTPPTTESVSTSYDPYKQQNDTPPKSYYSTPGSALNKSFISENLKTDGSLSNTDISSSHTFGYPATSNKTYTNYQNIKTSVDVPLAATKEKVVLMQSSSVSSPEPHILKNDAAHFPTFYDSQWATFQVPHSETSEESPTMTSPSDNFVSDSQDTLIHDTTKSPSMNPFLQRVKIVKKEVHDDEPDKTGWELLDNKFIERNGFRLGINPGIFYKSHQGIFVELCHGAQYEIVLTNKNAMQCDVDLYVESLAMIPLRLEGGKSAVLEGPAHNEKRFVFFRSRDAPREANIVPGNKNNGSIRAVFTPEKVESARTRTTSEPLSFTRSLNNILDVLGAGKEAKRSRSATVDSSHTQRGFDFSVLCEGATALQGMQKPKQLVKVEPIIADKGHEVELQLRLFGRTDDPSVPSTEEVSSLCPPSIEDMFPRKK